MLKTSPEKNTNQVFVI